MAGGEHEEGVLVEDASVVHLHGGVEWPALVDDVEPVVDEAALVENADREDERQVPAVAVPEEPDQGVHRYPSASSCGEPGRSWP